MLYDRRRDLSDVGRDLLAAADYIRERGWCQNRVEDEQGRVCIRGAFSKTLPGSIGMGVSWTRFRNAVERLNVDITWWNDAPGRRVEEVLDKLETAAWSEVEK